MYKCIQKNQCIIYTSTVVLNVLHSVALNQYVIISMAPMATFSVSSLQIQLLLVMNNLMVLIAIGQDYFMDIFQFIDARELYLGTNGEIKFSLVCHIFIAP